ncbi:hypothetical protein SeLEV6574_g04991 [Synchytrium endobioticum]|nr:hypothetical protein SeLEV6574_g04991 [Synchytrium endobioticum]
MTIYNLYIFDRHCTCVFFTSWNRRTPSHPPPIAPVSRSNLTPTPESIPEEPSASDITVSRSSSALAQQQAGQQVGLGGASASGGDIPFEEEAKLVYGVIFSLRNMTTKLTGKGVGDGFISYRTSVYKLHYFETATGLKFVLNTDPNMESCREALRQIYAQIYVEYVTKNPLVKYDTPITNELFRVTLQKFVRSMPGFD